MTPRKKEKRRNPLGKETEIFNNFEQLGLNNMSTLLRPHVTKIWSRSAFGVVV